MSDGRPSSTYLRGGIIEALIRWRLVDGELFLHRLGYIQIQVWPPWLLHRVILLSRADSGKRAKPSSATVKRGHVMLCSLEMFFFFKSSQPTTPDTPSPQPLPTWISEPPMTSRTFFNAFRSGLTRNMGLATRRSFIPALNASATAARSIAPRIVAAQQVRGKKTISFAGTNETVYGMSRSIQSHPTCS